MNESKNKRVLIKLSGEALGRETAGAGASGIDFDKLDAVAKVLAELQTQGFQMGIVIGGGNIFRGRNSGDMNRTDADHMGMLATAINALALKDALERAGAPARVLSAFPMEQVCDSYSQRHAAACLDRGEVLVFACGIGKPYFSTDTASALRALEIGAHTLFCAKKIDGVYTGDPNKDENAVRLDELTYAAVLRDDLQALDQSAVALCRDFKLPIFCFKLDKPDSIAEALTGKAVGTWIR